MTNRKRKEPSATPNEPLVRREKGKRPFIYVAVAVVAIAVVVIWRMVGNDDSFKPLTNLTKFKHHGDLAFVNPAGDTVKTMQIEIVDDPEMIQAGLMYRKNLTDDQGMLFILQDEEIQTFWMKNTVISLDMIFAKSSGEIVTIRRRTTPYSLESVNSTAPAKVVLEVRAGFADEYGILDGQRLSWHRLDTAGTQ